MNDLKLQKANQEKIAKEQYEAAVALGKELEEITVKVTVKAGEGGKVFGAGLDVFMNEPTPAVAVLMNDKISLSPHIGASTTDAQDKIGIEIAYNILEAFK